MAIDLEQLARSVAAQANDGEQLEVSVGRSTSTTVDVYDGEVESFTAAENFGIGVRVIIDNRQGFAHAGTFDDEVVAETLKEARDNAVFAEPDPFAGIAEPDGVDPVIQELWDTSVLTFDVDSKVQLAIDLEASVKAGHDKITGVRSSTYGDSAGEMAVASSAGLATYSRATSCYLTVSAMAEDDGETFMGHGVDVGRDPSALDLDKASADAVERATRLLGARQAASQHVPLLLEPRMAATVLGIVAGTLSGDRIVKQRSPFVDRMGEVIASPVLTLLDDPTNPASMGADTFDGEGLACRRNALITDGVLTGFLHNSYTGRKAGSASTGSAVRGSRSTPGVGAPALTVVPGGATWEELLAGIELGFLVQSMSGIHSGVNGVSGDFSVGAEGLMIRDGELAEPVREVTLASTLQRLLLDVEAVGSEIEWLPGGTGATPLLIGDVALSGS